MSYNHNWWRANAKFKEGDLVNYKKVTNYDQTELLTNKTYTIESLHPATPNGVYYQVIGHKGEWYWEENFVEALSEVRKKKLNKISKIS